MGELEEPVLAKLLTGFEPALSTNPNDLKKTVLPIFSAQPVSFSDGRVIHAFDETVTEYQLDSRQINLEKDYIKILSKSKHSDAEKEYDILSSLDKSSNTVVKNVVDMMRDGDMDRSDISHYVRKALSPAYVEQQERERVAASGSEPYFKNNCTMVDRYLLTAANMRFAEKLIARDVIRPQPNSGVDKITLLKDVARMEKYFLDMANGSYEFFSKLAEMMDIEVEEPQPLPFPKCALYQ